MRKIYISIIALLVSATLFAGRVSPEDAAVVANHFMNVAPAQANGIRKAAPVKRMVRKAMNTTTAEPQYYLYENADGEGWVIIAANDAVTPVLAYSETGHFRTDNMPANLKKWMGKYDTFIQRVETDGLVAAKETQAEWKALRQSARKAKATPIVGPLIQTKWDQDEPYNQLCPGTGTFGPNSTKAATGCVATAMAQVMNYWQWPKKGTGRHSYLPLDPTEPYVTDDEGNFVTDGDGNYIPQYSSIYTDSLSADFGNTTYDWANMTNSYSYSSTPAQKTAVATLMYHCGVATEMAYGSYDDDGSGTYTGNYGDEEDTQCAENALWRHFGYNKDSIVSYMRDGYEYEGWTYYEKWSDEDWTAMLKAELDKHHPIMYDGAGYDDEGESTGGHSFICDGYDSDDKFHFNWGWSGTNDGFFALDNLVPESGGTGGGSYDFNDEQAVIIGIVPDSTGYVEPTDPTDPEEQPGDNPTPGTGAFTLLTNINNLAAGDEVILVCSSKSQAAAGEGSNSNSSWFNTEDITITNNQVMLSANSEVKIMTVGQSGNYWTFTNNGQLLVATAARKVKFANSGASTWSISITAGEATILNSDENKGRFLYNYNQGNSRFTTYATTTPTNKSMILPSLFVRKATTTAIENTAVAPQAVKVIENGQIVIIRDNEKYTILGQKIQ